MAVTDNWSAGAAFAAADEDAVARAINGSGWLQPCHFATVGTETFTIVSGSVSTINGTALDGGSPNVGDRILIKDAPASSGTGSAFSNQAPNGIYQVTAASVNLSVTRVYEMSATPSSPSSPYVPSGECVAVMAGTANRGLIFIVVNPNSPLTFTYGTGTIQFAPVTPVAGTGLILTGTTLSLTSSAITNLGLAATSLQAVGAGLALSGTTVSIENSGVLTTAHGGTGAASLSAAGILVSGGALGTPASGTLTNATGLPITGLVSSTTAAVGVGTIELGHATDTTLSRSAAGQLAVEGVDVLTISNTKTVTNKDLSSGTNTFPTLNQNTTGNATTATKLATARTITITLNSGSGASFDGTADVTPGITGVLGVSNGGTGAATLTGLVKGNGTSAFTAAASGTDYAPATSGTTALKGNGSGGFSAATLNDVGAATADYSINSHKLTSLLDPTNPQDAATKAYVDAAIQGLKVRASVRVATVGTETFTVASGSVTTINGTTLDGISPVVGDRILITSAPASTGVGSAGSTQPGNGIYTVTVVATNMTVARATDMASTISPLGAFVFVEAGTAYGSSGWTVSNPSATGTFTYGTTSMAWTQFSGAGEITAGTGLSKTGNSLAVSLTGGTAITVTGATIGVTAASITPTQLSAVGTQNSTTYHRGDDIWATFATDARAAFSGGTAITIASGVVGVTAGTIGTTQFSATGTKDATTFLRGDNTFQSISSLFSGASLSGLSAPTASIGWGGFGITSLANPTNAQDAATKLYVDSVGYHPWVRAATTGTETFTISSGSVTTINGTSIDGVTVSIGDRILVKDAPSSSGVGSVLSTQPGNGIYVVTGNTTNLSLSRVSDMSGSGAVATPTGSAVVVVAGTAGALGSWKVGSPSSSAAFTYGTTAIQWAPDINVVSPLSRTGNTIGFASMATGTALIGNAGIGTVTTLGGDVTVGATGTVTIASAAVTLAKMANLAANSVIGNTSGSSAVPTAVSVTTAATAGAIALRDTNANLTINSLAEGVATTSASGTTLTLTVASVPYQQITGSTTQLIVLPNATTMINGQSFTVGNRSTGICTVQTNGGSTLQALAPASQATFTLISNSGSAGTWDVVYTGTPPTSVATLTTPRSIQTNLASTSSVNFDGSANITPGVTGVLAVANGGTGTSSATSYATTIGDGTTTSYTVTHSLGTRNVSVTLYDSSTFEEVQADIFHTTTSTLTIVFATAPTTGAISVFVRA